MSRARTKRRRAIIRASAPAQAVAAPQPELKIEEPLRIAGPEDFQELFRVSCFLHSENGQHVFSEEKCRHVLWRGCNQNNAIIGVIGSSTDIKAMIFLSLEPVYYSDEYQLVELFNFVRPDCRTHGYAARMLRFAKGLADETGLDLLIGIISDIRLEAKIRLYDRELKKAGAFFTYRPERIAAEQKSVA